MTTIAELKRRLPYLSDHEVRWVASCVQADGDLGLNTAMITRLALIYMLENPHRLN